MTFEREFFSVNELEQKTGISRWTWRRKAYNGEIESVKVGSKLMIPASEAERLISAGRRPRVEAR